MTPMMETALRAMTRGPLVRTDDGWTSSAGIDGLWNSHTMTFVAGQGWALIGDDIAEILPAGWSALHRLDEISMVA